MKTNLSLKLGITLAGVLALVILPVRADTFGTTGNEFTIDFVTIGNPGNPDDRAFDGTNNTPGNPSDDEYASPYGGVPYVYRMGTYELSQDAITKATASGLVNVTAGAWGSTQPAAYMTWYEAAAFVNWLNTSTGHMTAYNLTQIPPDSNGFTWSMTLWGSEQAWQLGGQNLYRNKDAYYFLPSEDEWYKAAYHQNDGVTANYWDYATGSNTAPAAVASGTGAGTAVYAYATSSLAAVNNAGGLSAYGTRGQGGNAWEFLEGASDGVNNSPTEGRIERGGGYHNQVDILNSSIRLSDDPRGSGSGGNIGFRVASVAPEPSSVVLLLGTGMMLLLRRRRGSAV